MRVGKCDINLAVLDFHKRIIDNAFSVIDRYLIGYGFNLARLILNAVTVRILAFARLFLGNVRAAVIIGNIL